jgi:hypothetical protein
MLNFLTSHPFYIPFILLNAFIVYKVIKEVLGDNGGDDDDDDDDEGVFSDDGPTLDLPPGVTLPVSPKEPVLND